VFQETGICDKKYSFARKIDKRQRGHKMLNSYIKEELEGYMRSDEYLLGQVFTLYGQGVTDAKELVSQTTAANRGVIYNNLAMIKALLEGKVPKGASMSRQSAWAVGRILKNNPNISLELRNYLYELKTSLENNTGNLEAVLHDQVVIDRQSAELARQASTIENGIYVYSFPTYLHFGTVEDETVSWFKIGSTKNSIWQRIVEQNRQTSMPEDPKLLRIYHKDGMNLDEIEKKFHSTLDRVGHERSSARRTKAGTEWFATTLDAIDAIAELMDLQIERYEAADESL